MKFQHKVHAPLPATKSACSSVKLVCSDGNLRQFPQTTYPKKSPDPLFLTYTNWSFGDKPAQVWRHSKHTASYEGGKASTDQVIEPGPLLLTNYYYYW